MNEDYKIQKKENLADLGQLQAGIVHELINPINFISAGIDSLKHNFTEIRTSLRTYVDILYKDNKKLPLLLQLQKQEESQMENLLEESGQLLSSIENGTSRLKGIIKSINEFSQLNTSSLEQVNVHNEIESALTILTSQLREDVSIKKVYGDLPLLYCFPTLLSQVFVNILINALQAIQETGTISIKTYVQGEFAIIKIIDSGRGIPKEAMKHIFDPFFTTKCPGQGTGLGLYISNNIIWKHLGSLEAESKVGIGTEFTIRLPIHLKQIMEAIPSA